MKPKALTVTKSTIAQCLAAIPLTATRIYVSRKAGLWVLRAELV